MVFFQNEMWHDMTINGYMQVVNAVLGLQF